MPLEANRTKQQDVEAAPGKSGREAQRLAELDYLDAVRPDPDHVLQEIVDELRLTFQTELCMVNLDLSDVQYFRAWSGNLPKELALARQDPLKRSMCKYVVGTVKPLCIPDFLATEELQEQYFCVNYGIRFYAGTPLVTSRGHTIGTLCLLDNRPRDDFGEEQMRLLRTFARAVVGRLELLGALERERAAREKEAQRARNIADIFESITDAFFALDKEWRFTYLNSEAEQLLNRTREELVGKNIWEEFPEAVGSTFYLEYRRALAEGVTVEFEEYYPPLETWVAVRAYPSESGLSIYLHDFTERKQAEEAMRDSEERYRGLYEDNPSMYFTLDAEGTVLSVNRFGARRLGYAPEELIGRSVVDIFHKEDRENLLRNFNACLKDPKRTGSWEARKIRRDGSVLWVQEVVRVVRGMDGSTIALVTCEDITERKQAERERAQLLVREQTARAEAETAQERLSTILNNLNEGVLVADPRGGVVFANPAARDMLGTSSGKTLQVLPELWEDFSLPEAVTRCARNGESIEARVSHGESYLRVKLELLSDSGRDDVLVVMQDLSEGHRLETNQQRFLANAAHQLRTPTMAVMGAAELLATGEDADPAMRRRLLDHIFSEGRRMQRLSDALLRLSRVGWDLREPNLEVVDLKEVGQQATELMAPLAESAGLRFVIEGEEADVQADPEWLQEVLLVLLSNAIKHSSRGGEIRLRVRDGSVTVEDEGVGISSDDLPYIFERFYRGKGSSEGFGLGLPISRELVERMGGSISVRSREGIGTTVEIELPKVDPDAQHNDS
jgi:PAS domain S-box-containing protein